MDNQVLSSLLELSIQELPPGVVQQLLVNSLTAWKERDWKHMCETAQDGKRRARIEDDRAGEAAALIQAGIAFLEMNLVDDAQQAFERAKRIFHRDPGRRHRLGESLATYALGLISDREHEAMSYRRQALNLLVTLEEYYAAEGNEIKQEAIHRICELLHLKVTGQIPIFYIGEMPFDLETDVEYRVIPIGTDGYSDRFRDFGVSSGDCVLVRRIRDLDEIVPGGLGVWNEANGGYALGRFERDAEGNVRFIQIGDEKTSVTVSDVGSVRRVDAILKPTRTPT